MCRSDLFWGWQNLGANNNWGYFKLLLWTSHYRFKQKILCHWSYRQTLKLYTQFEALLLEPKSGAKIYPLNFPFLNYYVPSALNLYLTIALVVIHCMPHNRNSHSSSPVWELLHVIASPSIISPVRTTKEKKKVFWKINLYSNVHISSNILQLFVCPHHWYNWFWQYFI